MGGEAPQRIWPRQRPPGKMGTVRQGLEPGTLFGPHAGTDVPADHRDAGGVDGWDQRCGQRQSNAGTTRRRRRRNWIRSRANWPAEIVADFAEAGSGNGDHSAGRALQRHRTAGDPIGADPDSGPVRARRTRWGGSFRRTRRRGWTDPAGCADVPEGREAGAGDPDLGARRRRHSFWRRRAESRRDRQPADAGDGGGALQPHRAADRARDPGETPVRD